jgi:exodeoxyribonuclease V alpha subunit
VADLDQDTAWAIRDSFKRGATVDQVAQFYKHLSRETLLQIAADTAAPDHALPYDITHQLLDPEVKQAFDAETARLEAEQQSSAAPQLELDETQQKAVELLCKAPFGIITGGAGVGKTTTMKAALAELLKLARPPLVGLCAPTGKAARRLREATGAYAETVHRMLGWEPHGLMWTHHAGNALPYDVIICDEASMLDTQLAAAMLDAVATSRTRVFFVGDVNQLPSVGPGRVFGDLIQGGLVPVVRLEKVHRQAQKSWVYRNAPRVLSGDAIELEGAFDDFVFFECGDPGKLEALLCDVYERELNRVGSGLAEDEFDDAAVFDAVQILIPQKTGEIGTEVVNAAIQRAFHGDLDRDGGFPVSQNLIIADGDKVIQTRNNYSLGVMNGETGVVVGHDDTTLTVSVDDEDKVFARHDAMDLQLGYAITVHRSQGSQWHTVIVVCHSAHQRMHNRNLFYTAITRAAKRLILIGDKKGIDRACKVEMVSSRQTRLVGRLRYAMGAEEKT